MSTSCVVDLIDALESALATIWRLSKLGVPLDDRRGRLFRARHRALQPDRRARGSCGETLVAIGRLRAGPAPGGGPAMTEPTERSIEELRRSLADVVALCDTILYSPPSDAARALPRLPMVLRTVRRQVNATLRALAAEDLT